MKKIFWILGLSLCLASCSNHYNEPIITDIGASDSNYGKYQYTVVLGGDLTSFWSNNVYKVGDTLFPKNYNKVDTLKSK